MEQLERACDPLEEGLLVPLRGLVLGPHHPANLGESREAVVHLRGISVHLPGIAPCPVDAHPPLAGRVVTRYVVLIVRARRHLDSTHVALPFALRAAIRS